MKKLLLFFCIALAAQVLIACSHDDNPIPGVDHVQMSLYICGDIIIINVNVYERLFKIIC